MSQTLIVRDRSIQLTDTERAVATKVLEQAIHGIDDKNQRRWKTFLRYVFGMEDGEIAEVSTRMPRSGAFHRYHMAIEQAVFNAQEKFLHFEQFRNWVKVGSGFCDWVAGPRGGVIPIPKSISYVELEEAEMRDFHADMLTFLRGPHAAPYLWKHLSADKAAEMMESILREFEQ